MAFQPGDKVTYEDHNWEWQPAVVVAATPREVTIDVWVDPAAVRCPDGTRAWTKFGRVERMFTCPCKLKSNRTETVLKLDGDRTVDGSAFTPGDRVTLQTHLGFLHPWRDTFAARVVQAECRRVVVDVLIDPLAATHEIRQVAVDPRWLTLRPNEIHPAFDFPAADSTDAGEPVARPDLLLIDDPQPEPPPSVPESGVTAPDRAERIQYCPADLQQKFMDQLYGDDTTPAACLVLINTLFQRFPELTARDWSDDEFVDLVEFLRETLGDDVYEDTVQGVDNHLHNDDPAAAIATVDQCGIQPDGVYGLVAGSMTLQIRAWYLFDGDCLELLIHVRDENNGAFPQIHGRIAAGENDDIFQAPDIGNLLTDIGMVTLISGPGDE